MDTASRDANQPPPLVDYDPLASDPALEEGLRREGAAWAEDRVRKAGVLAAGEALEWGRLANTYPPVLRTHDRFGERIDEVEFHPAWHSLMTAGGELGVPAAPWGEPGGGGHVARAAGVMLPAPARAGGGRPTP